ncbi:ABC transporter permease [Sodalis sp. RH16]|jgi:ribose transport system permease protein|uniref:ABC transporter permease n=1 Tax=Sodalis sp. RH16 TaxID=3394331 RepID=UPI0039B549FE
MKNTLSPSDSDPVQLAGEPSQGPGSRHGAAYSAGDPPQASGSPRGTADNGHHGEQQRPSTDGPSPAGLREFLAKLLGGGWICLLLIALIALFWLLRPAQFGSAYNLSQIAINAAILLVLSVGQTFVIIAAGIDLSVGAVLVFSSVISAQTMLYLTGGAGTTFGTTDAGWGIIALGTLVSLLAGALWGALNGFLIAVARIPALIVTLGTFGMALGLAQIISGGVDVRAIPERLVDVIGSGDIAGIPMLVVIAVLVTLAAAAVLHLTRFGLHVFATGSNMEAVRRAGVNVRRRLVGIYMISGALAGMAAVMSNARFSTTTIGGHAMDNLSTISAVVLGGTSLFGGIGSVAGTVIGVFIPIILLNGFVILGIPPFWQTVAMGAVLILAVWIDQLKRRARERG